MRAGVFCLLLLVSGGIMFAQSSKTQGLSITVTPPPSSTGNLLTGMTPASYTLPAGWSLLCTQDFDQSNWNSACESGNGRNVYSGTLTRCTDQAHSGTYSLCGTPQVQWTVQIPAAASGEVYMSWYEFHPSSGGYYFGGGNWSEAAFYTNGSDFGLGHAGFDWCCGAIPWGATSGNLSYGIGQNTPSYVGPLQYITSSISMQFDSTWHQYELHYIPNTATCDETNMFGNGTFQFWRDGTRLGNVTGACLNGPVSVVGTLQVGVGGDFEDLLWLTYINGSQVTSQAQCNTLIAYGTGSAAKAAGQTWTCSTAVGTGYGCVEEVNLTFAQINSFCPGEAPPRNFNKYVDDLIFLYR